VKCSYETVGNIFA